MDKLELLLDMTEHPERYTEQQIQDLLNDEDVRKHYDVMVRLREAFAAETTPLKSRSKTLSFFTFKKIAAIFLAAVFLGGLVFAAYRILSPRTNSPQPAQVSAPSLTERTGGEYSLIRFSDIRLDSILTVVSAHYGKSVCFRDTTTQSLRLNTVWDSEDSLAVFIEALNEFDELRLSDERDTIFVESVKEEDKG